MAALPVYVARVLTERGVEIVPVIADGIVAGADVLDGLLSSLERTEAGFQRHSPLELFREALRPVDHAMDVAGVPTARRDEQQQALVQWDRYNLSPGSSKQLGAEAHEAHFRWGLEKAGAHAARPRVGLLCGVADAPRLEQGIRELGYDVQNMPPIEAVRVAVVDIEHRGSDQIIRDLSEAGVHVVCFGEVVDDVAHARTRALGGTVVISRDELLSDLAAHLPAIV